MVDASQVDWARLKDIFHEALAQPEGQREAYCRAACADDPHLLTFVLELLSATRVGDTAIRDSVATVAIDNLKSADLSGERVGAYYVERMLGRGGMGEVYLARRADGEYEKEVVIKVMQRRLHTDLFVQRFRMERQVLATLRHPNIPALLDAGQLEDGRPFFVTEFINGETLDTYCDMRLPRTDQKLALFDSLCAAVGHAHGHLVLHLDIKPANILVEADGTPHLLDFGVARLMNDTSDSEQALTPAYASPEQLRGATATAASDLYSLGVLLYRMLAGREPLSDAPDDPLETRLAARDTVVAQLTDVAPIDGLSRDLQAIVAKALAPDPAERYASVDALLADLRNLRLNRPVTARPATLTYHAAKSFRRNAAAYITAALAIGLLTAFGLRELTLRKAAQAAYAQAARDATTSEQITEFMINLFSVSDPSEARGNAVTARELLDGGARNVHATLSDQPQVAAQLFTVIGEVYESLGLPRNATPMYEDAVAAVENIPGESPSRRAKLLSKLGDAYQRAGDMGAAEDALKRSLALWDEAGSEHRIDKALALSALGLVYMRNAQYLESEKVQLEALALREQDPTAGRVGLARQLSGLAGVYFYLGRYDEAVPLMRRAIDELTIEYGEEHSHVLVLQENLGSLYDSMGDHDAAVAQFEPALALRRKTMEPGSLWLSNTLTGLSAAHINAGRFDQAEPYLLEAIEIQVNMLDADDRRIALSRTNLAELYVGRGQLDDAQRSAQMALESLSRGAQGDMDLGRANHTLARIHVLRDAPERAVPHFEAASEIFGQRPADDPHLVEFEKEYAALRQKHPDVFDQ